MTVVRGVISEAKTPPRRSTRARTSRLENNDSLPVSTTWSPANGCRAEELTSRILRAWRGDRVVRRMIEGHVSRGGRGRDEDLGGALPPGTRAARITGH